MSLEKLFVYGTLRKGFRLHKYLADKSRFIGTGMMQGILYDLGDYPGVMPSGEGEVLGEVYELEDSLIQLEELDDIEGFYPDQNETSMFIRSLTDVKLTDGNIVQAWVYVLPSKPANARQIPGGNYQ